MAFYSEETIDEVINSNDIVDIVSKYVSLKRRGRNFLGLCPFHKEKTASFVVSPDKQIFHCFGCNAGGNVISFISKIENLDFKETVESLAENSGIALPESNFNKVDNKKNALKQRIYKLNEDAKEIYHKNIYYKTPQNVIDYIKKRKLNKNTIDTFEIGLSFTDNKLYLLLKEKGYTEEEMLEAGLIVRNSYGNYVDRFKNRLMFTIKDTKNRVIGFGGRVLDDSLPKYVNSPENIVYSKRNNLFGLNVAKKSDTKNIILTEGYMDMISLYAKGFTNVVASLGTALTKEQAKLLRKYTQEVIMCYDSDAAGQAAILRGLDILSAASLNVRVLQMDDAKDPDEYINQYGTLRFEKLVLNAISLVEFKIKMAKQGLDLNTTNDKIKFLNETAKILSSVKNKIEQEIYIDKISKEYGISLESIYGQIERQKTGSKKILESRNTVIGNKGNIPSKKKNNKIEEMLIYLLIEYKQKAYEILKNTVKPEDFEVRNNQIILKALYDNFEKGILDVNSNVLELFDDQEIINDITGIMSLDYKIDNTDKAINDIIHKFKKEQLTLRKNEIIKLLEEDIDEKEELEKELNDIILKLHRK